MKLFRRRSNPLLDEKHNVKIAQVAVHLEDGSRQTITRVGRIRRGMGEMWTDKADTSLREYLDGVTGLITLDNKTRVPLCSVHRIEPMVVEDHYLSYNEQNERDKTILV